MTPTPLPWSERITVGYDCGRQCDYWSLVDSRGRVILDTLNSEVAEIHQEVEDLHFCQWDEQGRLDIEFLLHVLNNYEQLVYACTGAATALQGSRYDIGDDSIYHDLQKAAADARSRFWPLVKSSNRTEGRETSEE